MSMKALDKKIQHRCYFMVLTLLLMIFANLLAYTKNQQLLEIETGAKVEEIALVKLQGITISVSFLFLCFFFDFAEFVIIKFLKVYQEQGGTSLRENKKVNICARVAKAVYVTGLVGFVISVLTVLGFAADVLMYSEVFPGLEMVIKPMIHISGNVVKCLLLAGMGISAGLMIGAMSADKKIKKHSSEKKQK